MKSTRGVPAEDVNQSAKHVLFVEGKEDGVDGTWLKDLFPSPLEVKPLGPSFHVKSVAQALHPHHPTYYFLIDRDHFSDEEVEFSWANFPDPNSHNLLIWRRKEIESYFLDPALLIESEYLKPETTASSLENYLVKEGQKLVFLAAANATIVEIRESSKRNWIQQLNGSFDSSEDAQQALVRALQNSPLRDRLGVFTDSNRLTSPYLEHLKTLTGGGDKVRWGSGTWLHQLPAKAMFNDLMNRFTKVTVDLEGPRRKKKTLQGKEASNRVVTRLLQNTAILPNDFKELVRLLRKRIGSN